MSIIDNITVNEQSSIRIAADKILRFDPLHISGKPHDADIIFITHEHYDHFSPDDIAKASKAGTLFVAPKSMANTFKKANIPDDKVTYLEPGYSTSLLGISIKTVPAYNLMKPFHPKKNGWLGYVVTIADTRIYVCGDTDSTKEGKAVSCDIVCVPIGGTFTMTAKQAAEFVNAISPKFAIPIHYGTIVGKPSDADEFEKNVDSGIEVNRKISFYHLTPAFKHGIIYLARRKANRLAEANAVL